MRVIFFGTSEFAVPSLEQLLAHQHEVVLCVTQPDRPQGRGLAPAPSPVKRAAIQLNLPLAQPERPQRTLLEPLRPDVGVAAAYGELIGPELLELPRQGMLGVHPSLLPKYRGAAPVAWAILNGETATGVTIFQLDERLDAGDILVQRTLQIEPGETAEALTRRLSRLGADALIDTLELMAEGRLRATPQEEAGATLAPKLTKAQGRIAWEAPAEGISRLIRATMPWPGASTTWRSTPLKIWSASAVADQAVGARPGTVIKASGDTLTIAAGRGMLEIRELQPAGKRRLSAKEFLIGHAVQVGEQLGGGTWNVERGT